MWTRLGPVLADFSKALDSEVYNDSVPLYKKIELIISSHVAERNAYHNIDSLLGEQTSVDTAQHSGNP